MFWISYRRILEINEIDISLKTCDNIYQRVHFVLGLVVGDNLGLNSFLGFSRSFSSTSYCRFCKITKTDAQTLSAERSELIRTRQNYESDLLNLEGTGIVNRSLLNNIPSFHVVENFYVGRCYAYLWRSMPFIVCLMLFPILSIQ